MVNNRTPLYEEHVKLNGKIIDFHGWDMPLQYTKILEEHMSVRKNVGIFDVSHMGDIIIEGKDSSVFLDYMFPTKISNLAPGEATYTAFLNEDGKIIDDTIVYRLENEQFFVVPNASMIDVIYNWMLKNKKNYSVNIRNISSDIACIAVQGPRSIEVIEEMGIDFPGNFKFKSFNGTYSKNMITGKNDIIVSGTGYTGETGVELIISAKDAVNIWRKLIEIITKYSGLPCGLGSRDTLRMEKGMLLSGVDFNYDRDPYECSISFIVNNDSNFIGKDHISSNSKYIFRGFKLNGKSIPRAGSEILLNDRKIGIITSGTISPVLNTPIALGFVKREDSKSGTHVSISVRGMLIDATMGRPKLVP